MRFITAQVASLLNSTRSPEGSANFTTEQVTNLLRGTRSVLAFGIVTSIAANVLHSLTRPEVASDPMWKVVGGAILSALAPIVLFACIELVSRIPIQSWWLGAGRLLVTFLVGGFAGWASYWHMESVAEALGENGTTRYLYPLIIDGMMLVATISLIELGRLARTVEQFVAAAAVPQKNPNRVEGGRKAAAKRATTTTTVKTPAAPRRKRASKTPSSSPVSPAAGPNSPTVELLDEIAAA